MADFLLDTNILSYWYDTKCHEHARVVARVNAALQPTRRPTTCLAYLSPSSRLAKLSTGTRVAHAPDPAKQAAYAKFVREQCPVALEMTKHVAEQYGEMRAWLFNNCGPNAKKSKAKRAEELVNPTTGKELGIDENDIWIAAQAKTHNLVLVTHDSRGNFGKILKQFARL